MKLPRKTLEKKLFKSGYRVIYAVDEVGMGCLAGPVVVCAMAFKKKFFNNKQVKLKGVADSKLLNAQQREKLAIELMKNKDIKFQISFCYPKTIDRINIYSAARKAMKRAVFKLSKLRLNLNLRTIVLVDGKTKIKGLDIEQMPVVKGDRKIFAIACASIIAKVHRDKMMTRYAKKYPNYGFEKHKGYGTKHHQAQLVSLGPSSIHRKSFAPVAKLV